MDCTMNTATAELERARQRPVIRRQPVAGELEEG